MKHKHTQTHIKKNFWTSDKHCLWEVCIQCTLFIVPTAVKQKVNFYQMWDGLPTMLNDQIFSWTLKRQALSEEPISQTESDWGGKQLIIKASNKQFVCPQKNIICTLCIYAVRFINIKKPAVSQLTVNCSSWFNCCTLQSEEYNGICSYRLTILALICKWNPFTLKKPSSQEFGEKICITWTVKR